MNLKKPPANSPVGRTDTARDMNMIMTVCRELELPMQLVLQVPDEALKAVYRYIRTKP